MMERMEGAAGGVGGAGVEKSHDNARSEDGGLAGTLTSFWYARPVP